VAARAAYERAEQRGHREAAMSLGNLLRYLGDFERAEEAYFRSLALGSNLAALNLGMLLAQQGKTEDALPYLEQAAEAGDPLGFWGLGKIKQQEGDTTASAEAYRQGADLGNADCAWELGAALLDLGNRNAAKEAFEQARDLGHDNVQQILDAIEREETSRQEQTSDELVALWTRATDLTALASYRKQLGQKWIAESLRVGEDQKRLAVLDEAISQNSERLAKLLKKLQLKADEVRPDRGLVPSPPAPVPSEWLEQVPGLPGSWRLVEEQAKAFDADFEEALSAYEIYIRKWMGRKEFYKASFAAGRVMERLNVLKGVLPKLKVELERSGKERSWADLELARTKMASELELYQKEAVAAMERLPAVLQPWTSPVWELWSSDDRTGFDGLRSVFAGFLRPKSDSSLGPNAEFGSDLRIPFGLPIHRNWLLYHDGKSRGVVHAFVRAVMVRMLLTEKPGELSFSIFDPVGLGESAGELLELSEYNPELIGGKVWSTTEDLNVRLAELTAHIELVIQKYLRATYQTIDEYNRDAGEVAEPYRLLVLFDFPTGLTPELASRLRSIIENGPRCGVFTLLELDQGLAVPSGIDIRQFTSASVLTVPFGGDNSHNIDGYQLDTAMEHETLPDHSRHVKRIIESVGQASVRRSEVTVTFDKAFGLYSELAARGLRPEVGMAPVQTDATRPSTWWTADSTRGVFAPIGQKGARDVAILGFDSADHSGALLVGRPGSGKSTLLHAYIGGVTLLYSPNEVELYLIDFKEGVEFKAYAEEGLPHAKVIAIESDREFGLSVLESVQAEISERAELLRSTGGRQVGLQGLREATGDKIPRILLVFDEFQVLFARNDKIGLAAANLLESIIRQGRGFGVHVLLGSQSLSGLDALGGHVTQLLPVRILLPASDSDAHKVLGDNNNAGEYLTGHGDGILNAAGGLVEANERFKGALLAETDRVSRLKVLRAKADNIGFKRMPVVFEGAALLPLDAGDPTQFREELAATGVYPLRLRVGQPMTVGEVGDLTLLREAGSNVLAVVRSAASDDPGTPMTFGAPYGLLVSAVASVAATSAAIDIIDFLPNDDGLDGLLAPFLSVQRLSLKRRRAFPDVISCYVDEVKERLEGDDLKRSAKVLFLFGIHRARDLSSDFGSLDADADTVTKLEQLMRDGPEVGVHVWLWAESVNGASRRLTSRMMREIGWRIAGRMSADDSQELLGHTSASDLRESQLWMINEDQAVETRLRAFAVPSVNWLSRTVGLC
jgi:tetratricopeptide (TPR) repeat protein